jgi:hypothetical protein
MEPLNDKELNQLLRKWEAPNAPASMRLSAGRSRQSLWKWLWSGRIHVPVPVGVGLVFAVVAFGIYSGRSVPTTVSPTVGSSVEPPAAPSVLTAPPTATPPSDHTTPTVTEKDEARTAALSGFQPVQRVEPKIVGVQP